MGDYRTTTGEAPPLPSRERRRRRARWAVGALGAAAGLGAAAWFVRVPCTVPADGYVTTEAYAEVRAPVPGIVAEIRVRTGASVQAADLLVQLDASELAAALEEAREQARKADAELRRREAAIAEESRRVEEQAAQARLREQHARSRRARAEELHARGLAAAAAVEDARLQEQLAASELAALLRRDDTVFARELEVLRTEAEIRRQAVTRAEAQLRRLEVRAPIAGQVVRYEFVVGELVRPDTVLYEIFGGDALVLKLRVPERYAGRVAPGQGYRAELRPYGGLRPVRFEGRVEELRNVIQSEGTATYRAAYGSFDAHGLPVPPGTSAEVRIRAGSVRLGAWLFGAY